VWLGLLLAACGPPPAGEPDADLVCAPVAAPDTLDDRDRCAFGAGDLPIDTLGVDGARLPITHVIVVMQENRSYDHMLGQLEGVPAGYTNPDVAGDPVAPFPLESTCLEADPPHQWDAMHAQHNGGAMDGFVTTAAVGGSDGRYALGYYTEDDLPFYYWAARTFARSDAHFASVLGGTWANRNVLYTGSTYGTRDTGAMVTHGVRSVYDQLDDAGVRWGVYTDGWPRQDTIGWDAAFEGRATVPDFLYAVETGTLPPVSFVDPAYEFDEHPPNDVQPGQAWTRMLYEAVRASSIWPTAALIFTYDEGGGLFDHVSPPPACPPMPELPELDVLGHRVPLILFSPWARAGHASEVVTDHASILRFIQLLHGLPALGARDANADALLDLFDFDCDPDLLDPPPAPEAPVRGC